MNNFIVNQFDYIFFIYGFSFIVLSAVLYHIARLTADFGWRPFGIFTLLHGLYQWLEMLAVSFSEPTFFQYGRFILLLISVIFLLEFGRTFCCPGGWCRFKGWIYVALVLVICFAWFFGFPKLRIHLTYFAIFISTLLAGWALYRASTRANAGSLKLAAGLLVLYGVAGGLLLPLSEVFSWMGASVLFARAVIAALLSLTLWIYYCGLAAEKHETSDAKRRSIVFVSWISGILLSILAAGAVSTYYAGELGQSRDLAEDRSEIEIIRTGLDAQISIANQLVKMLASEISYVVKRQDLYEIGSILDQHCSVIPDSVCYLMDPEGDVLDSSNRNLPLSYVGKNYSVRPYFKESMAGKQGFYIAIGLTTGTPGYFTSYPILTKSGEIVGVAAAKVSFSKNLLNVARYDKALIVDRINRVILESNDSDLRLQFLDEPGDVVRQRLKASEQYPYDKIAAREPLLAAAQLRESKVRLGNQYFLRSQTESPVTHIDIVHFSPEKWMPLYRLGGIAILLIVVVLILSFFVTYQSQAELSWKTEDSERTLSQYRQNMMAILDNLPIIFWRANENGVFLLSEGAGLKKLGLKPGEVVGKNLFDVYQDSTEIGQSHRSALAGTGQTGSVRIGDTYFQFFVEPLFNVKNEVKGLLGVAIDMSEQKRMEVEKQHIQAQLLHSSKLASVGTLAAGVAHEINNPLTISGGFVEVLRDLLRGEGSLSPEGEKHFDRIIEGHRRIATIVKGLRTYARADTESIEGINLHSAVTDSVTLVRSIYLKQGVEIHLDLKHPHPFILANTGKIQQVVMNLLSNAKDALKGREDGTIAVSSEDRDGEIVLTIQDNGTGIPEEMLARIFEPFFTTKAPGEGTGLGLALVHSMVTGFGGRIKVASKVGVGTSFSLSFKSAATGISEEVVKEPPKVRRYAQRILVAEDEEGVRIILRNVLEKVGFEVTTCENGLIALEKLKEEAFDLLLTDLKMPKMSGFALIQEAKKLYPLMKCVVLTGGVVTDYSAEERVLIRQIADNYLTKPFDNLNLISILGETLKKTVS